MEKLILKILNLSLATGNKSDFKNSAPFVFVKVELSVPLATGKRGDGYRSY